MRSRHLCAVLVVATLVSLAACSGSVTDAPSASPTAAPTPAPTAASTPAATPSPAPTPDVQGILDRARESYGAPGALAVLRVGDRRTWAASGSADTAGTPITAVTRFRIASITKPIVAALVLDAVDRGELALDDVVGDLLADLVPDVLRADPPVTVRQLLAHTSGIYDESNGVASQDQLQADIAALADPDLRAEAQADLERALAGTPVIASDRLIVALSETHDRYFAPGAGYHYSNTNYQLAAMVLEKATGMPPAELLRTRIVEPLGLERTTIAPPDTASPELRGYGTSTADGSLVDITDDFTWFGNGGNGGIISTADELLTIMQAIVGGRLLPAPLVAEMKAPTSMSHGSYGLGLGTYKLSCGTFYGHEGGVNGTASIAIVSPDGADGVVIALNLRSGEDPRLPALADAMLCGGR
jgi:D-alanyl-D-alanine carboxypeptidase